MLVAVGVSRRYPKYRSRIHTIAHRRVVWKVNIGILIDVRVECSLECRWCSIFDSSQSCEQHEMQEIRHPKGATEKPFESKNHYDDMVHGSCERWMIASLYNIIVEEILTSVIARLIIDECILLLGMDNQNYLYVSRKDRQSSTEMRDG